MYRSASVMLSSPPSSSVECLDISSKTTRRLANIPKPPLRIGLSISPDERWMLVTLVDRNESDLMMVEHFR
jgi:hypothetical protein